jgi:hypothetical protein
MTKKIKLALLFWAIASTGFNHGFATAEEITVNGPYHFLDNRADNSVGILNGLYQQFGANSVVPNLDNGTTGLATQGGASTDLKFADFDVAHNFSFRSIPYNSNLTGSWDLTFQNGTDTTSVATPAIIGAQVVPFANSVTISGSGAAPRFAWTVPDTFTPDAVRIQIFDTGDFRGNGGVGGAGVANIIYSQNFSGATNSFTVAPSSILLDDGHNYSFEINLLDTRNNQPGGNVANILSSSRSFFDFSLLSNNAPPNVVLPTLVNGTTPYYSFNTKVVQGQTVYIDPLVAIGYDYLIGDQDPNFTSVLLPTGIGDNQFFLWLWNGTEFADSGKILTGGVKYAFEGSGVDRFRILGIETSVGLDPFNATAFITGLEFATDGQFTGTMTPLTAPVPEPATLLLFCAGIMGLAAVGRRKRN